MNASLSAAIEPIPVVIQNQLPNALESNFDFWIKIVSVFSTAFSMTLPIILGILLYLVWSNQKQKEKANIELKKIVKMRKDSEAHQKTIHELSSLAESQGEQVSKTLNKAKSKNKKIKEAIEKNNKLNLTLNSLTTVSSMNPGDISTEAKKDSALFSLEEIIKRARSDQEKTKSAVEEALELFKQGKK